MSAPMPPLRNGAPAQPQAGPIASFIGLALGFIIVVLAIAWFGLVVHVAVRLFDFGWRVV